MAELNDYSGPYNHNLKFADFSKEFLIELLHSWQWAYMRLSSIYYAEMAKRLSAKEVDECNLAVWIKVGEKIVPRLAKVGNIEFNTIMDGIKACQLVPDGHTDAENFDGDIEVKSENHVITTTRKCVILEMLEKYAPERINHFCHELEARVMQSYFNNPKITVTPLKLPPRDNPNDICCSFEIKLED
jgi:hypothetical protein